MVLQANRLRHILAVVDFGTLQLQIPVMVQQIQLGLDGPGRMELTVG